MKIQWNGPSREQRGEVENVPAEIKQFPFENLGLLDSKCPGVVGKPTDAQDTPAMAWMQFVPQKVQLLEACSPIQQ